VPRPGGAVSTPVVLTAGGLEGSRVSVAPARRSSFANSAARGIPVVFNVSSGSSGGMSDSRTSVRTGPRGPLYAAGAGDEGSSGNESSRSGGVVLVRMEVLRGRPACDCLLLLVTVRQCCITGGEVPSDEVSG